MSEAINSMFRWYRNAQICYVWLRDVQHRSLHDTGQMTFRGSAWFTRGWTLQELLAPRLLVFYDRSWTEIGSRTSLEETIASITGIKLPLDGWRSASVAQKMSWAAKRKTSRVEDIAYCLLGLFGVNMAPLYGEGMNAFLRLQLEIISKTSDQSIFAWTEDSPTLASDVIVESGLLAYSPTAFLNSRDVQQRILPGNMPSYSVTNRGLRMEQQILLPYVPTQWLKPSLEAYGGIYVALLNCSRASSDEHLGVYLRRHYGLDDFGRVKISELPSCPIHILRQNQDATPVPILYVRQLQAIAEAESFQEVFRIDLVSAHENGYLPPSFEASEPSKLSSPTNSPWNQLLVFEEPFAHPAWAIFTFSAPGEDSDFEVLVVRDRNGINTRLAITPTKFERAAKRSKGPNSASPCYRFPYFSFPSGSIQRLPSGKGVSVTLRETGTDQHLHLVTLLILSKYDLQSPLYLPRHQ